MDEASTERRRQRIEELKGEQQQCHVQLQAVRQRETQLANAMHRIAEAIQVLEKVMLEGST